MTRCKRREPDAKNASNRPLKRSQRADAQKWIVHENPCRGRRVGPILSRFLTSHRSRCRLNRPQLEPPFSCHLALDSKMRVLMYHVARSHDVVVGFGTPRKPYFGSQRRHANKRSKHVNQLVCHSSACALSNRLTLQQSNSELASPSAQTSKREISSA